VAIRWWQIFGMPPCQTFFFPFPFQPPFPLPPPYQLFFQKYFREANRIFGYKPNFLCNTGGNKVYLSFSPLSSACDGVTRISFSSVCFEESINTPIPPLGKCRPTDLLRPPPFPPYLLFFLPCCLYPLTWFFHLLHFNQPPSPVTMKNGVWNF